MCLCSSLSMTLHDTYTLSACSSCMPVSFIRYTLIHGCEGRAMRSHLFCVSKENGVWLLHKMTAERMRETDRNGHIAMNEIPIISSMFSCLNECTSPGGIFTFVPLIFHIQIVQNWRNSKTTVIGRAQLQIQTTIFRSGYDYVVYFFRAN